MYISNDLISMNENSHTIPSNVSGNNNVAMGSQAGINSTGNNNIFIGSNTSVYDINTIYNNSIVIGYNGVVDA